MSLEMLQKDRNIEKNFLINTNILMEQFKYYSDYKLFENYLLAQNDGCNLFCCEEILIDSSWWAKIAGRSPVLQNLQNFS